MFISGSSMFISRGILSSQVVSLSLQSVIPYGGSKLSAAIDTLIDQDALEATIQAHIEFCNRTVASRFVF